MRRLLAGFALTGALLSTTALTAQAAPARVHGEQAAAACTSWATVNGDSVRIRAHHSTSSTVRGLIHRGQRFCFDGAQSWPQQDGYVWAYGHSAVSGITGWVVTRYLNLP
ncbi:hypothetical protein [Kribbella deserti]|uniref:SH3 domain-containing protein n=1 Tax=Kribbella deserti TaxID=1926257 RepID=A0ABV6QZD7_9ACTN